jgi:hypothetical protein
MADRTIKRRLQDAGDAALAVVDWSELRDFANRLIARLL